MRNLFIILFISVLSFGANADCDYSNPDERALQLLEELRHSSRMDLAGLESFGGRQRLCLEIAKIRSMVNELKYQVSFCYPEGSPKARALYIVGSSEFRYPSDEEINEEPALAIYREYNRLGTSGLINNFCSTNGLIDVSVEDIQALFSAITTQSETARALLPTEEENCETSIEITRRAYFNTVRECTENSSEDSSEATQE